MDSKVQHKEARDTANVANEAAGRRFAVIEHVVTIFDRQLLFVQDIIDHRTGVRILTRPRHRAPRRRRSQQE
jgi:hypothetical protein